MDLAPYGNSIGISDVLQWRSCPSRFELGMRRHTEGDVPGTTNENNAYGSAIHYAIHEVEINGVSNEEAVSRAWGVYGGYLDPEDRAMLLEDLNSYRRDTPPGWELVAAERNLRVPLFVHDGVQIYFRFTLDALYRRASDHTAFLHRDYKSSKWPKSQAEVDNDLQMWAYNWAIYELWPECRSLTQHYEQLRHGNRTTGKNAEQRVEFKAWLIETVKAILADEKLEPKQEQFCAYCPLVVTCEVTKRSPRYWKARLGALAPRTKEGRKTRIAFMGEAEDIEYMLTEVLPTMIESRKHMEAVEKACKEIIEEMPSVERERLGWRTSDRKTKVLSSEGLRALHAVMGEDFYEVVSLTRAALERSEHPQALATAEQWELARTSATTISRG